MLSAVGQREARSYYQTRKLWEKPLNCPVESCRDSSEEVTLLTTPFKTFLCPSKKQQGKTSDFFWRLEEGNL